jgi:hypothetical protein
MKKANAAKIIKKTHFQAIIRTGLLLNLKKLLNFSFQFPLIYF